MYTRDDPVLCRELVVVASSSKYFETILGCLHASQDFAHSDAVTCFQRKTSLFCHFISTFNLKQPNNERDIDRQRVVYLFPKTFKNLFSSAARLLTVFNHLNVIEIKENQ